MARAGAHHETLMVAIKPAARFALPLADGNIFHPHMFHCDRLPKMAQRLFERGRPLS